MHVRRTDECIASTVICFCFALFLVFLVKYHVLSSLQKKLRKQKKVWVACVTHTSDVRACDCRRKAQKTGRSSHDGRFSSLSITTPVIFDVFTFFFIL